MVLCQGPFARKTVNLIRVGVLAIAAMLFSIPAVAAKTAPPAQPTIQEDLNKASLPLYTGKQVCGWISAPGMFGDDWDWSCKFKSRVICTTTVIAHEGHEYLAITTGHCIDESLRKNKRYYISDTVEGEPVLRQAEVLKAENDDRYDFAILRFESMKEYPVIHLNDPEDGSPAIGTELLNVNYSLGFGKQSIHGVVTSDALSIDDMKNRFLTTLQSGPGSSGSAIVDAKTGKIVGLVELGFPRSAMGAGGIPTGKLLFNFMEDDSAGLPMQPVVGDPPQPDTPPVLTTQDHLMALWEAFVTWLKSLWS